MISKISFSKLVREEFRHQNWLLAILFLAFGLLIPFRVLLVLAVSQSAADAGLQISVRQLSDIFYRSTGLGLTENTLALLLAGGVSAISAFSWLHAAPKLDFYHSLALTRTQLFAVKYTVSITVFLIPWLASQLLAVVIGAFYQALTAKAAAGILAASVQGILFFLCSYSGVLLALLLTGKLITTLLAVAVFAFYGPMMWVLTSSLSLIFATTVMEGSVWSGNVLRYTSPWAFCLYASEHLSYAKDTETLRQTPVAGILCQVVVLICLLTAISLALYRIRKTEAAGNALAFGKSEGIIKLMLSVPAALLAAYVAYEILEAPFWEALFILLFGSLACIIMEFIYRMDLKQALAKKRYLILTALISCGIFFALRFDISGYNTYLPEKEDLAAMAILDNGIWHVSSWYDGSSLKRLDNLETESFDAIYRLAQNGVEGVRSNPHGTRSGICPVQIKYRTGNGREEYRSYYVDQELLCDSMNELLADPGYRARYFPVLSWDGKTIRSIAEIYCSFPEDQFLLPDEAETETEPASAAEATSTVESAASAESASATESIYTTESYVTFTVSPEQVPRFLDAYTEDLGRLSYEELISWCETIYIIFDDGSEQYYPLSGAFENTLHMLYTMTETRG